MHWQKKTIHRAILELLLIFLIFLLTTYISHGLTSSDSRSETLIDIVDANGRDQKRQEKAFIQLLDSQLYSKGFETEIIESTEIEARQYLNENPSTMHLITDIFFLSEDKSIRANLYTQGTPSPKEFKSDRALNLVYQIYSYLISDDLVETRAQLRAERDNSNNHLDQGLLYLLTNNEIDKAIKEFKLAASENPRSIEPHINLAICYDRIGNYKKAKEHIELGKKIDKENDNLKNHEALIYFSEKNFDEGVKILENFPLLKKN